MSDANSTLLQLREQLTLTRYADRPRLARELARLFARRTQGAEPDRAIETLRRSIDASAACVARLKALALRLDFDPALPISAHRGEIIDALRQHPLIIVCGATGSGKTTQLPGMCIEAGRGGFGLIGHTQPRRIAARAIADRVAQQLGTSVGGVVGYQVRFSDHSGPDCRVKLMTDGILLRELGRDRLLRRYDTLIIDEAHERSLNIDFLFGVLRRVLPQRPELRVIITSATIDPRRFSEFFGGAPIIEVSGRSYPVEVRYRPLSGEDDEAELSLNEGIVAAVRELDHAERGDVLVFLPGEKQIRDAADALAKAKLHHTEILPLYARLSARDQQRIFEKHGPRRLVLATNVAETSLTVPGIRHVVDSGLARISRYSVRGKVQRLPIEPISQASAEQRKGRSGRESTGICIRLYSEDDFNARPAHTEPEVLRTNLASVILQMASLELGEPEDFPFVDPPDTRLINDGYRLLQELKAVDESRAVTSLGRQISTLPLDPRLARMLLAATHHGCLSEMLVIAAFLATQDPRERPPDAQQQAAQRHASFSDPRSDFVAILNLWNAFREQSELLSASQLRKWSRENFLSSMRMREWQELHRQLRDTIAEFKLRLNQTPAGYADLHQAILTGFLGNIGALDQRREYEGARGSRFVVAPGTPLASKPPKWLVAAQLMETTRLYARTVGAVEPQWIEAAGAHLIKRSYSEPHWLGERGFVAAFESTSLYGLTLAARRRVNYGAAAPEAAREIFVREALVQGCTGFSTGFLDHNRRLREDIEQLEAKLRRRDILVDEQAICDFYLARLPAEVHSTAALSKFLRSLPVVASGERSAAPLTLSPGDLMRRETPEVTATSHPDNWIVEGNALPIHYRFEPGAADDGATIILPLPLLSAAVPASFSSPIAGWRMEKITEVLRSLPKPIRKSFVPAPQNALRAASEIDERREFNAAMAQWITRACGVPVTAGDIAALPLPEHLRFNIRVVDLAGGVLAEGRDLMEIKRRVRQQGAVATARAVSSVHRRWDFGAVDKEQTAERGGLRFTVYPTLRDRGDGVELAESPNAAEAEALLRAAVLRLATLALPEQYRYARRRFAGERDLTLLGQALDNARPLADALAERSFADCFLQDVETPPRTADEFHTLLDQRRASFGEVVDRVLAHSTEVLRALRTAHQKLDGLLGPAFQPQQQEVRAHLSALIPAGFPASVPALLWPHLPRFLQALVRRLEKVSGNQRRDAELMRRVTPCVTAFEQIRAQSHRSLPHAELDRLQWMIEELRVSLFAQELHTALPVSEKRIAEQAAKARSEARIQ